VYLRAPGAGDRDEFVAGVKRSRTLHGNWVTTRGTPAEFAKYFARLRRDDHVGFFVCRREDAAIVGVINLNAIVRGLFHSAYLGYYALAPHAGKGYMTEGLRLVMRHAFVRMKLHRLEANIQPGNVASIALVKRLGFRLEGHSPRYLKIAGRWRDHERWAITVEDWRDPRQRDPRRRGQRSR
jgi:ribosomal-protein-alanine N-acetyltransferase